MQKLDSNGIIRILGSSAEVTNIWQNLEAHYFHYQNFIDKGVFKRDKSLNSWFCKDPIGWFEIREQFLTETKIEENSIDTTFGGIGGYLKTIYNIKSFNLFGDSAPTEQELEKVDLLLKKIDSNFGSLNNFVDTIYSKGLSLLITQEPKAFERVVKILRNSPRDTFYNGDIVAQSLGEQINRDLSEYSNDVTGNIQKNLKAFSQRFIPSLAKLLSRTASSLPMGKYWEQRTLEGKPEDYAYCESIPFSMSKDTNISHANHNVAMYLASDLFLAFESQNPLSKYLPLKEPTNLRNQFVNALSGKVENGHITDYRFTTGNNITYSVQLLNGQYINLQYSLEEVGFVFDKSNPNDPDQVIFSYFYKDILERLGNTNLKSSKPISNPNLSVVMTNSTEENTQAESILPKKILGSMQLINNFRNGEFKTVVPGILIDINNKSIVKIFHHTLIDGNPAGILQNLVFQMQKKFGFFESDKSELLKESNNGVHIIGKKVKTALVVMNNPIFNLIPKTNTNDDQIEEKTREMGTFLEVLNSKLGTKFTKNTLNLTMTQIALGLPKSVTVSNNTHEHHGRVEIVPLTNPHVNELIKNFNSLDESVKGNLDEKVKLFIEIANYIQDSNTVSKVAVPGSVISLVNTFARIPLVGRYVREASRTLLGYLIDRDFRDHTDAQVVFSNLSCFDAQGSQRINTTSAAGGTICISYDPTSPSFSLVIEYDTSKLNRIGLSTEDFEFLIKNLPENMQNIEKMFTSFIEQQQAA